MNKIIYFICVGTLCTASLNIIGACEEKKETHTTTIEKDIINNFVAEKYQEEKGARLPDSSRGKSVIIYSKTECVNGKKEITEDFDFEGKKWIYKH